MSKKIFEIIIYGRGGQGAKTTAEIIAQGALLEDKFVQAFPEFGPERSGAPVQTFVRISDKPVKTREPVLNPDCFMVLDETLLGVFGDFDKLSENSFLIINTQKSEEEILKINIPTGIPYVFTLDDSFQVISDEYLIDEESLAAKMEQVANQGKA